MGNNGVGGGETLSSVLGAEYSQKWKRGPATVKKSCYNRQTCIRPKIEFAQISSKDALNQTFLAGDSRLENFLSGGEKREHHLFLLPLISVSYSLPSSPPLRPTQRRLHSISAFLFLQRAKRSEGEYSTVEEEEEERTCLTKASSSPTSSPCVVCLHF